MTTKQTKCSESRYRKFYETATGLEIPDNHEIHHLDFNRKNNSIDNEMDLDELFDCPYSTYRATLNSGSRQILCMSKAEGHAEGIYLPISEEFEAGLFGSIFCRDLSLYKNGEMIRGFMISIATYNTAFGSPKDPYDVNLCKEVFEDIVNFLIKSKEIKLCIQEPSSLESFDYIFKKE